MYVISVLGHGNNVIFFPTSHLPPLSFLEKLIDRFLEILSFSGTNFANVLGNFAQFFSSQN
jgi:hypothetical protein